MHTPSRCTGATQVMSFRWLDPRCGSFTRIASPGRNRSGPNSRTEAGAIVAIATRCDGCAKDCAMQRSFVSKKAQEKSARVLMFVE